MPRAGTLPKGSAAAATAAATGRKAGSEVGSESGSEVVALGAGVTPPELVEATIRKGSDVVGKSIRGAAFRARFHAAVISVKRNGVPLQWTGAHIGDEILLVRGAFSWLAALLLLLLCLF